MIRTFDGVALSFWHSKDSSSPPGTGILKRSIKIQTHSQYLNTHNFSSLNGLRGLSIVAVVAFHCQCFVYGNLGVNLFFVISGFLITTLLLREKLKYSAISLKCFYVRRALRIFPLYFTVVLVYVLVVYLAEGKSRYAQVFWGNLPYFLTYTSNWFVDLNSGPKVIFYFAWSLAAEEQFYSTWPFIEKYLSEKNILVATVFLFIASQTCQFIAANYFTKVPLIINILSKIPAEILGGGSPGPLFKLSTALRCLGEGSR